MVELQILNKVLDEKSLRLLTDNKLSEENFASYEEEYHFIVNHYEKHGVLPDVETVLDHFNDFEVINVGESDEYLVHAVREETKYRKMVPVIQKAAEVLKGDANECINYIKEELETLTADTFSESVDIVGQATDRLEAHLSKKDPINDEFKAIPSGFDELDEIINGLEKGEELITIAGRTNHGKSWVGLYLGVKCWENGYRVGVYSGEMSENKVGYRFDSLYKHFSNRGLIKGADSDGYEEYIQELGEHDTPFHVCTQKYFGHLPSVPELEAFCRRYEIEVLVVDQLSLTRDSRYRNGDQTRIQYAHITEDLFKLSTKLGIPVILLVQLNRSGDKDKEDDTDPRLSDIKESDDIAANSSKVLLIRQIEGHEHANLRLRIIVGKNREGAVGDRIEYLWDIDKGVYRFAGQGASVSSPPAQQIRPEDKQVSKQHPSNWF